MKIKNILIITILIVLMFSSSVYSNDFSLDITIYNDSLKESFTSDENTLNRIEAEVFEQVDAVTEAYGISSAFERQINKSIKYINVYETSKNLFLEKLNNIAQLGKSNCIDKPVSVFNDNAQSYLWKAPIVADSNWYIFSIIQLDNENNPYITTVAAPNENTNAIGYIFDESILSTILDSSELHIDYETLLPVSFSNISTDIIVFSADGKEYGIPFSARPDLLNLNNGQIYTFEEIKEKLEAIINEMTTSPYESNGFALGETDQEQSTVSTHKFDFSFLFYVLAGMLICGLLAFSYKKKKHNN